jgi:hypothetical protein
MDIRRDGDIVFILTSKVKENKKGILASLTLLGELYWGLETLIGQ